MTTASSDFYCRMVLMRVTHAFIDCPSEVTLLPGDGEQKRRLRRGRRKYGRTGEDKLERAVASGKEAITSLGLTVVKFRAGSSVTINSTRNPKMFKNLIIYSNFFCNIDQILKVSRKIRNNWPLSVHNYNVTLPNSSSVALYRGMIFLCLS